MCARRRLEPAALPHDTGRPPWAPLGGSVRVVRRLEYEVDGHAPHPHDSFFLLSVPSTWLSVAECPMFSFVSADVNVVPLRKVYCGRLQWSLEVALGS